MSIRYWPFDNDQRAVVSDPNRLVAITGGPGSGKTHALVARCWRLLNDGAPAEAMQVLVSSRQAADEARSVLSEVGACRVETMPEFCARLLRRVEGASFSVLSDAQAVDLLAMCLSGNLHGRGWAKGKAVGRWRGGMLDKAARILASGTLGDEGWDEYLEECERRRLYDRWMLVERAAARLAEDAGLAEALRSGPCQWVLADDVHWWGHAERRLLQVMMGEHGRATLAGDLGQRVVEGVDVITRLLWDWPGQVSSHRLEYNHRGLGSISDLLGRLSSGEQRSCRPWGEAPVWLTGETAGESEAMAAELLAEWRDGGLRSDEIAVIDLRTGWRSPSMEVQMSRLGFDVGPQRWEERRSEDVQDAEAMLRLALNPRDVVALSETWRISSDWGARKADPRWISRVVDESWSWNGDLCEAASKLVARGAMGRVGQTWLEDVASCVRSLRNRVETGSGTGDALDLRRRRVFDVTNRGSEAFWELVKTVSEAERGGRFRERLAEVLDDRALSAGMKPGEEVEILGVSDSVGGEWRGVCVLNAVRPREEGEVDRRLRELYVACGRARDLLAICDYRTDHLRREISALVERPWEARVP